MILLDIMLPGKDGIEVLANVKAIYPSIPIIILSGIGQIKTVVEAMKMGASDYLTKPFEEEALELTIQNAIEKERLKEEVKTLKQQLAYVEQGNIRQLENIVKRYLILPDADVTAELRSASPDAVPQPVQTANVSLKEVAGHATEMAEKEVVLRVLEETGWNRKESARRLKISYKALRNKLKKWQLVREKPSEVVRTLVKSA